MNGARNAALDSTHSLRRNSQGELAGGARVHLRALQQLMDEKAKKKKKSTKSEAKNKSQSLPTIAVLQ
jgi:hypothetical protein